jgi:hypothetical protein
VSRYKPEDKPELTQSQILIELAGDAELFHTPDRATYAQIPIDEHRETWGTKSKTFRRWLVGRFFARFAKPPGSQALQDALGVIEARAQFEAPELQVFVRVTECGDRIYIDLANETWEAVEVGPHGWRIIASPPVRFRRAKGMRPLPRPIKGGLVGLLRQFLNLSDFNDWILIMTWITAACRPRGPYPVLILEGEQGSAKSTTARLLRNIIDPSTAPLRSLPREDRDLLIAATNSWVVALDNVSSLPPWLSDGLCRLATGGGYSTRELYTDDDEVFFDAMRPVILNGIDHLSERPDLADRALILRLPAIQESERRDEKSFYAEYERQLPLIFGAVLDAVGAALARQSIIKLDRLPRMADFALWGVAVEEPLGFCEGAFLRAYGGNRTEAVEATLEADPVATAVRALLEAGNYHEPWQGTAGELLTRQTVSKSPAWPRTARGISGRLRRLVTFLREAGVEVTFAPKGTRGRRLIIIHRRDG